MTAPAAFLDEALSTMDTFEPSIIRMYLHMVSESVLSTVSLEAYITPELTQASVLCAVAFQFVLSIKLHIAIRTFEILLHQVDSCGVDSPLVFGLEAFIANLAVYLRLFYTVHFC